jgi:uncharacterized membrane protein YbjE (DUF340 family)
MDFLIILADFIELFLIPTVGLLTVYLVVLIKNKTKQITDKTDSDLADKYINMLSDTITTCVMATNQTYVSNLKKENMFDKNAQKEALNMTADAVKKILSADAQKYLNETYGDVSALIMQKIEAEVAKNK